MLGNTFLSKSLNILSTIIYIHSRQNTAFIMYHFSSQIVIFWQSLLWYGLGSDIVHWMSQILICKNLNYCNKNHLKSQFCTPNAILLVSKLSVLSHLMSLCSTYFQWNFSAYVMRSLSVSLYRSVFATIRRSDCLPCICSFLPRVGVWLCF